MRIYLAGPLGFSEAGKAFHDNTIVRLCHDAGLKTLDPWKLTDPKKIHAIMRMPFSKRRQQAWKKLNPEIAENNRVAIEQCDAVLAVLDGVDVDSGTAAEIGYAFAKHKRIFGYRGDIRLTGDNEGATVNLQVEHFINQSGGRIVTSVSQLKRLLASI